MPQSDGERLYLNQLADPLQGTNGMWKHISFDREDVSLVMAAGDDTISAQFRRTQTSRNMLAVLLRWLCLAGSIVFPEAFGPLHRLVTGRAVRFAIRNIPYYYVATFSGLLGSLGLVWLWWTVKYNYVWLIGRILL